MSPWDVLDNRLRATKTVHAETRRVNQFCLVGLRTIRGGLLLFGVWLWVGTAHCQQVLTNRFLPAIPIDALFSLVVEQRVLPARIPTQEQIEALKAQNPRARYTSDHARVEHVTHICRNGAAQTNALLVVESIAYDYPPEIPFDYAILATHRTETDLLLVYRYHGVYLLARFDVKTLMTRPKPLHYFGPDGAKILARDTPRSSSFVRAAVIVSDQSRIEIRLEDRRRVRKLTVERSLDEFVEH